MSEKKVEEKRTESQFDRLRNSVENLNHANNRLRKFNDRLMGSEPEPPKDELKEISTPRGYTQVFSQIIDMIEDGVKNSHQLLDRAEEY